MLNREEAEARKAQLDAITEHSQTFKDTLAWQAKLEEQERLGLRQPYCRPVPVQSVVSSQRRGFDWTNVAIVCTTTLVGSLVIDTIFRSITGTVLVLIWAVVWGVASHKAFPIRRDE